MQTTEYPPSYGTRRSSCLPPADITKKDLPVWYAHQVCSECLERVWPIGTDLRPCDRCYVIQEISFISLFCWGWHSSLLGSVLTHLWTVNIRTNTVWFKNYPSFPQLTELQLLLVQCFRVPMFAKACARTCVGKWLWRRNIFVKYQRIYG